MGRLFPQPFAAGQPKLADRFYGFSYMYDRTAAIGLLDGQPRQFGSVAMSYNDIAAAGQLPLLAQCGPQPLRTGLTNRWCVQANIIIEI